MLIFLNSKFVPEEKALVSVFDRGFLYGDGLFEAVRILNGEPFRWQQHMQRFWHGANYLKIHPPLSSGEMEKIAEQLIAKNNLRDGLLRLNLSRGIGVRGYSPKDADSPTFVMSVHALPKADAKNPPRWKLITASHRLPADEPLAQFKSSNKLPQILSRAEADDAGADEALLLSTSGRVVEGTTSNLFWIRGKTICTPPLATGILPGVTRATVLEICRALKLQTKEIAPRARDLFSADGAFLSMSSWGIVEVGELDGRKLRRSPLVKKLRDSYEKILRDETA
jgi:branched-chain amino acid aminotransferase